jgi:hypothetical protein
MEIRAGFYLYSDAILFFKGIYALPLTAEEHVGDLIVCFQYYALTPMFWRYATQLAKYIIAGG